MINNELFFTFIKINYDYNNLLVCKYWYNNIIKHIKKKKENFYDMYLYNAIHNKYMYILYNSIDSVVINADINSNDRVIVNAHNNIICNIMKEIIRDDDIKDNIMDRIIETYKKLSILISFYNIIPGLVNDTNYTEKYIADEYSNILKTYFDYGIILT
jgi:uncharacterized membrane-anchored protein YjiN (DUF445 family)